MLDTDTYGIREYYISHNIINDKVALWVEEIKSIGFTICQSLYSYEEVKNISDRFDSCYRKYIDLYGYEFLKSIDEHNGIRLPLSLDVKFIRVSMHPVILEIISSLVKNKFILNQQNGVINPPFENYNQNKFHRDLPYQHFVSTRPLAISALYCVDDFTVDNGATILIPYSHHLEQFPSKEYVEKHSLQLEAPAGSYIVFDSMLFHKGGYNATSKPRRAINSVYSIPIIKQQIYIPRALNNSVVAILTQEEKEILGFNYSSFDSVNDWLYSRKGANWL